MGILGIVAMARILSVRPMTREDLEVARLPSSPVRIKALRDAHHGIARLFAAGMSLREIADETGYSVSRLSLLRKDPQMQDLIAKKQAMQDEAYTDATEHHYRNLIRTAQMGQQMIVDQFDEAIESGERLPLKTLLAVTGDANDRIGYVRKSLQVNANVNFAKDLEEAIKRRQQMRMVEVSNDQYGAPDLEVSNIRPKEAAE